MITYRYLWSALYIAFLGDIQPDQPEEATGATP
jgi:hypothetical protein